MFITAFTSVCQLPLSSTRAVRSMPSQPISLRTILILSSHLCLILNKSIKLRILTRRVLRVTFTSTDSSDEWLLSVVPRFWHRASWKMGRRYFILKWIFPRTQRAHCEFHWLWSNFVITPQGTLSFVKYFVSLWSVWPCFRSCTSTSRADLLYHFCYKYCTVFSLL
jgi:hypothetical protein